MSDGTKRPQITTSVDNDLRTRIAAAVRLRLRGTRCATMRDPNPSGLMPEGEQRIAELAADAVIRELKLTKQHGCPVPGHHTCTCSHRYTTPWKDND